MEPIVRDQKLIQHRCELLESLGFTCNYQDSNVSVFNDVVVDFSAIHEDMFIAYALASLYAKGVVDGEAQLRKSVNLLLSGSNHE